MNIERLDLWHRNKKGKLDRIKIKIKKGTPITEMKLAVTSVLKTIQNKTEYYYVVAVVTKSDGSKGYRTIVPKTVAA